MRVCDYIAKFVYEQGVQHVFTVVGGGMMYLADGLVMQKDLKVVCTHHEQAAAMAAVSYAKYNGNLGVAYVTTGCGGTNALTGVLNGWQDNVSCLFISGQSNRKDTIRNSGLRLRQVGVQEADIVSIVSSITKYSVMINEPSQIKYHLQKAVFLARTGRKGPVWIDIPLDVQRAEIDEDKLVPFDITSIAKEYKDFPSEFDIKNFKEVLSKAHRPIIIAGQGIRHAGAIEQFKDFVERTEIPFVVSRLGINLLPTNHPKYIGRIGVKGDRAGNFAVQNADLVIVIGSRLSVSSTGYDYSLFAREATIVVVDIDREEHKKEGVRIDYFINSDAKGFFMKFQDIEFVSKNGWSTQCSVWRDTWQVCLEQKTLDSSKGVNTYYFVSFLSKCMEEDAVVVSDAGSSFYVTSQAIQLKENQRYITSGGQAEMGYTLPATIGVCFARGEKNVIGITGDGSFQMNIQELQTLKHYKLPVKLFVWNNNGYSSIRDTQNKFFGGRLIGTDSDSGVSFPDLEKIAGAYGIEFFRLYKYYMFEEFIKKILLLEYPVICEVMCEEGQQVLPTIASFIKKDGTIATRPLEDMYPLLDRGEFYSNMIIKPIEYE